MKIEDKVNEVREVQAWAQRASDADLDRELKAQFATEWRWNIIADEINRRRTVRRLEG